MDSHHESEVATWIDTHVKISAFESHFWWRSSYIFLELIGQTSTPLDSGFKEKFEKQFQEHLFGLGRVTAKQKLLEIADLVWGN